MAYAIYQGGQLTRAGQLYGQGLANAAAIRADADVQAYREEKAKRDALVNTGVAVLATMAGVPPPVTGAALSALSGEPMSPVAMAGALYTYQQVPVTPEMAQLGESLGMDVRVSRGSRATATRGVRDELTAMARAQRLFESAKSASDTGTPTAARPALQTGGAPAAGAPPSATRVQQTGERATRSLGVAPPLPEAPAEPNADYFKLPGA